jgi:hypothetical protein
MFHRELLMTARYVWCHKQLTMRAQKLQQQNQTHKYQKGKIMRNTFLNYLMRKWKFLMMSVNETVL